ncbi:hypothetical protein GLYMA_04G237850v4 [Glycine max]|nr:hypothetical protein GLYMA_04G237850v4 [Glycine max]KAH1112921.1 hypothetical protein GYH30_010905 [Glycine max]
MRSIVTTIIIFLWVQVNSRKMTCTISYVGNK